MNEYLIQGFYEELEKHAGLSKEDINAGLIGLVPFATTFSTSLGDRPKGHKRLKEWAGRVLGGVVGGTVGDTLGRLGTKATRTLGVLGGSVLGEAYAHKVWGPKKKKYR
jgi:hypothetical protein